MTDADTPSFVVHDHRARAHHYDLRLERDGILWSWAVPKGIPQSFGVRHLAVRTDDHPIDYLTFEGKIPQGNYGAGEVTVWDTGTYTPVRWETGRIEVLFRGAVLKGHYLLIRFTKAGERDWLIFKTRD
ncbi:MAG: ATP-dependent DNA ligase [Methanomicrobiales archaeon]|nr:ATP-dependent DNA ligase [Methanomicrobiales archaeon]